MRMLYFVKFKENKSSHKQFTSTVIGNISQLKFSCAANFKIKLNLILRTLRSMFCCCMQKMPLTTMETIYKNGSKKIS